MSIIFAISDHDAVVDVEGVPDKYIYEIMYMNRIYHIDTHLEYKDEMSVKDRQRFVTKALSMCLQLEAEAKLEERPEYKEPEDTDDAETYGLDPEDEDVESIHVIEILNQLASRIEDIEIRLNKDK